MNRRQFCIGISAAIALTPLAVGAQTPVASQDLILGKLKTKSVALADGLVLVDYRFVDLKDGASFAGEIRNELDTAYDAIPIGITWFDGEGNIVGADYATPMTYVIDAGDLLPVTQPTLEFNPFQEEWDSVAFSICGDWMTQNMIDMGLLPGVEITGIEEHPGKESYAMSCLLKNTTDVAVESATVFAIFRDNDGRPASYIDETAARTIPPGKSIRVKMDVGVTTFRSSDPFDFLQGVPYKVDLRVAHRSGVWMVGCS